jgi:hypothetical protein
LSPPYPCAAPESRGATVAKEQKTGTKVPASDISKGAALHALVIRSTPKCRMPELAKQRGSPELATVAALDVAACSQPAQARKVLSAAWVRGASRTGCFCRTSRTQGQCAAAETGAGPGRLARGDRSAPRPTGRTGCPRTNGVLPATGRTRTTGLGRQPGPAGPAGRPAQGDPGPAATFRVVTGRDH